MGNNVFVDEIPTKRIKIGIVRSGRNSSAQSGKLYDVQS